MILKLGHLFQLDSHPKVTHILHSAPVALQMPTISLDKI